MYLSLYIPTTSGKGSGKKLGKVWSFSKPVLFQRAFRVILGPPKHVLHLVWSAYIISTAIRTALKVARRSRILGKRRPVLKRPFSTKKNGGCSEKLNFLHNFGRNGRWRLWLQAIFVWVGSVPMEKWSKSSLKIAIGQ